MSFFEKYERQLNECNLIKARIMELELLAPVKEYSRLKEELEKMKGKCNKSYKEALYNSFNACDHIWMHTKTDCDSHEGRSFPYYTCIKCGLDGRVYYYMDHFKDPEFIKNGKLMYDYLTSIDYYYASDGPKTDIDSNYEVIHAICKRILEKHPDIDDETLIRYIKFALYKMETVEVSGDRKISRRKRLFLR